MKRFYLCIGLIFTCCLLANAQDGQVQGQIQAWLAESQDAVKTRDFKTAISQVRKAQSKCLSEGHLATSLYGDVLHQMGLVYYYQGVSGADSALVYFTEAKAVRAKILGVSHPDYAQTLNKLGLLYTNMNQFEQAAPILKESVQLAKVHEKEEPLEYASSLVYLGYLYQQTGRYEKAEPLYVGALNIRKEIYGVSHIEHALDLDLLALLYVDMGLYEKAEQLHIQAIDLTNKTGTKNDRYYISFINNLAVLYDLMGAYEKAESLYLEVKLIYDVNDKKQLPAYALNLNNLAFLYKNMGNYQSAESFYKKSLSIIEQSKGKSHPDYAWTLDNLASLYLQMEAYEKAKPLCQSSLSIREDVLGTDHPDYAKSLHNMALYYAKTGALEKAESLFESSIERRLLVLGAEHPDYARSLVSLANLYRENLQFEKAEQLYLNAIENIKSVLGEQHPELANSKKQLAHLYVQTENIDKAIALYVSTNEIEQTLLVNAHRHLSEKELGKYIQQFEDTQDHLFSLVQQCNACSAVAYDHLLFYKGFLLNTTEKLNRLSSEDTSGLALKLQLKAYHRRLAIEYSKPLKEQKQVEELEVKVNSVEKELARNVTRSEKELSIISWKEVQNRLGEGAAAIEFVHYNKVTATKSNDIQYAAMVLQKEQEQPVFVPLFVESSLEELFKASYSSEKEGPFGMYDSSDLYALIWAPLDSLLKEASTIYFSPSGMLHQLNNHAILTPNGDRLSDKFELLQLNSTRQIVKNFLPSVENNEAILFGDIVFELDTLKKIGAETATKSSSLLSNEETLRGSLDMEEWAPLKWTEVEITAIEFILEESGFATEKLIQEKATEESFKRLTDTGKDSPRVVHLATHGFFFENPSEENRTAGLPGFKIARQPLIRSGLVLAGGNYAWKNGNAFRPDMEDGILTAYEISQLNLAGTELVVLSACETGLGDIKRNEGVYGLQRAFKMAGAQNLLMSLWQVPDFQTQEFMTCFYSEWLLEQNNIQGAFRLAQQQMRKKYPDPFYWAGFVLVK